MMANLLNSLGTAITQLPHHLITQLKTHCFLCGNNCAITEMVCGHCLTELPRWPVNDLLDSPQIANNIEHQFIDELYSFGDYQPPLSRWLKSVKYSRQTKLTRLLAQLIESHLANLPVATDSPDHSTLFPVLTVVPIHVKKWSLRGFNQCHEIIKRCNAKNQYNYVPDLMIQLRDETKQAGLSGFRRRARRRNFQVNTNYRLDNQHVILFDDVLTTGSTVNKIANQLKQAGAKYVTVLTIAVAVKR